MVQFFEYHKANTDVNMGKIKKLISSKTTTELQGNQRIKDMSQVVPEKEEQ